MSSVKNRHFVFLSFLVDALAVIVSSVAAYQFRFASGFFSAAGEPPGYFEYFRALIAIVPINLWFFRAYGLYQGQRYIRRIEEIFIVIKSITFAVIILTAITFFYRRFLYSRLFLVFLWFFSVFFVSLCRYYLIQWEYHRKEQRKELTKTLLIGANRNARHIIQWSKSHPHYGQQIVGVLAKDTELVGKHLEGTPILGTSDQAESFINTLKPERVALVDPSYSREQITDLVVTCEDKSIDFKVAADFYGLLTRHVDVEYISSVPMLGFRSLPLDDIWNRLTKRALDILAACILLVLTLPIWVLAYALIKWDDRGPVIYSQERIGRDQVVFKVFKFRTMTLNAEKDSGPVWTKPQDGRRTRVGPFLRRWNIDELPQLLNVLKGNMSLVGPRPERPHFVHQFRESIPRYMARHKIKCGISGWAQVNGYRGNTSLSERIKYDLYYMENWSLLFDIEILFMTLFAFKNAY